MLAAFEDVFHQRDPDHDVSVVLLEIVPGDRELPTASTGASGDARI